MVLYFQFLNSYHLQNFVVLFVMTLFQLKSFSLSFIGFNSYFVNLFLIVLSFEILHECSWELVDQSAADFIPQNHFLNVYLASHSLSQPSGLVDDQFCGDNLNLLLDFNCNHFHFPKPHAIFSIDQSIDLFYYWHYLNFYSNFRQKVELYFLRHFCRYHLKHV